MISITIPIIPTGQARARATIRGGHANVYKSGQQRSNENAIMAFLAQHAPSTPMTGPVSLYVHAFLPIPKSKPKRWREDAISGVERPTVKPDIDNICKNIKDCLTMLRFWDDDRQVVRLVGEKKYSDSPRWEIKIYEV